MAFNTKTFITRTASAAVFVAVLLLCVWYNYYSFSLFFALVGFVGLHEFYTLSKNLHIQANRPIGFLLHAITVLIAFFYSFPEVAATVKLLALFFIVCCSMLFVFELFSSKPHLSNIAYTIMAWLYVSLPFALLIVLGLNKNAAFEPQKVLGMIFFIWINDTGAYLVGSFLGKNKMYEKISPGKTWEGTIGGVLLCVGLSFLMVKIFPQLDLKHWMAVSAIVAVFGTVGDLVESMFKRLVGVKDSGSIMPGHGGVLDRFDSLIFSTPFVFAYLAATGNL
ncbi:MAG TPA: phosphatidate cytidylyltransferase [Bacteroidia bacterium]|jgi:phosphatidate cytidylyltransferase|nr:phosphatidate cytidylyltransferase [Bacteroidia bacterium]